MKKEILKTIKDINELISLAISSAKIKKLIVEETKGSFNLRPTLHILLRSPVGSCKSTILNSIGKEINQEVMTEITQAGLIGSIDKTTHTIIPAKVWECRNNLLLIDEFNIARHDWQVFLQLLEDQIWNKKFAVFSGEKKEEDEDLYFTVKDGNINLKTRFACILATMKLFEFQRGQEFRAFVSRTIPYEFKFNLDDLKYILKGGKLFNLNYKVKKNIVTIKRKDYNILYNQVIKYIEKRQTKSYYKEELLMRCFGDCARIFAVLGKHNRKLYERIMDYKFSAYEKIGEYYKK